MSNSLTSLLGEFRQASFRGVPFAVMGDEGQQGRRIALHEYPFRDSVWPEDLGRRQRTYRIRGFITGPTCLAQRDLLILAAEQSGPGLFIHPTIGIINASVLSFTWREPDGCFGVVEVEFEFVEYKSLLSTSVILAAAVIIGAATLALNAAATTDFEADTSAAYSNGSTVTSAAASTASVWGARCSALVQTPQAFGAAVAGVPGYNGRYALGNASPQPAGTTVAGVLLALAVAQAGIASAVESLEPAQTASALATAIFALPEAVRAAIADPGVQISLLAQVAGYTPSASASAAPIGASIATVQTAVGALCRRATLLSLANASSNWQPTSYDDAEALRAQLGQLLAAEILVAADAGDTATYQALRTLRTQVLQDLAQRASQLPRLITVTRNRAIPALVLAQQLYADATRAPDIIQRSGCIHPSFLPTTGRYLAS